MLPPMGLHEVSQPVKSEFSPWGEGRAAGAGVPAQKLLLWWIKLVRGQGWGDGGEGLL